MDFPIDITGIVIETKRLLLKAWEEAYLEDFFEYASVEGVGVMAGWPAHQTIEDSRSILNMFIEKKQVFAIFHKDQQKVIGSLGLHHSWANEDDTYCDLKAVEIGYVLSKDYWGQGLMPEAVQAVIQYYFQNTDLDAFTCGHFSINDKSKRVIEKCGFQFVSRGIYHAKLLNQDFEDLRYILLRRQWASPLNRFYTNYNENERLSNQSGQVEFLTTIHYIQKYLFPQAKVMEIGAGTGRYSRAIADLGYCVDAVELFSHNIDQFKNNIKPNHNIRITQGNALDLSIFQDNSYDITLLLGPLYHLYTEADKKQALAEALRITKPGGIVFAAYCISDASIVNSGFMRQVFSVKDYIQKGKIDPVTFATTSVPEDIFELVRKEEIDQLMSTFPIERLHYVSADLFAHYMRDYINAMDYDTFQIFMRYHLSVCERSDMTGITNHSLDIFKKL